MKRRRRVWLAWAVLLVVAAAFVHPAVRWGVIGWARGEAFYQGRPTSYWVREVRRLDMLDMWTSGILYFFPPERTKTEQWLERHTGIQLSGGRSASLPLDDPAAVPVLLELLKSEDFQVRLFAIQALGHIGPDARPAWDGLRETSRTTQEYLVYREAGIALYFIDPQAAKDVEHDRPDADQLWERYKATLGRPHEHRR
jgi:hypothetical protein